MVPGSEGRETVTQNGFDLDAMAEAISRADEIAARGREPHRFLTTEEVAELFRTRPETVRYWRHIGTGPQSFKVGRRVLYAREDVDLFIAQQQKR